MARGGGGGSAAGVGGAGSGRAPGRVWWQAPGDGGGFGRRARSGRQMAPGGGGARAPGALVSEARPPRPAPFKPRADRWRPARGSRPCVGGGGGRRV